MIPVVTVDQVSLTRLDRKLTNYSRGTRRALADAVNASLVSLRTRAAARLNRELNLTDRGLGPETVVMTPATGSGQATGSIQIDGRPISLVRFPHNPTQPGPTSLPGVSVKTRRGKAADLYRGSFIARDRSGEGRGVYERVSRVRSRPLDKRFGPSPADVARSPEVAEALEADGRKLLDNNVRSEISQLLIDP